MQEHVRLGLTRTSKHLFYKRDYYREKGLPSSLYVYVNIIVYAMLNEVHIPDHLLPADSVPFIL